MLVHMYRHVFSEGIGLRQMMDYAMLLKRGCTEEEKTVFGRQAKELNLYGFAGAVMYVMERVFGLNPYKERQELQTAEGISGGGALGTGFQGVALGVEENEKLIA